jgi:hypothetical protein
MRACGFLAGAERTVLKAEGTLEAEKDAPLRMAASVVSGESFGAKGRAEDGKTSPPRVHGRSPL